MKQQYGRNTETDFMKKIKYQRLISSMVLAALLIAIVPCKSGEAAERPRCPRRGAEEVAFTNDRDKMLIGVFCWGNGHEAWKRDNLLWTIYDIKNNAVANYSLLNDAAKDPLVQYTPVPEGNKKPPVIRQPAFSRGGKQIVFTAGGENHRNIFIMNADGSDLSRLTHDYNENPQEVLKNFHAMRFNEKPSFSPDGKRIIFVRSAVKQITWRPDAPSPSDKQYLLPSRWDVYEINLETGEERRLTKFGFKWISQPQYFSDGRRFVFYGEVHIGVKPEVGMDEWTRYIYWVRNDANHIFIMTGDNDDLKPAFRKGFKSNYPHITWDDTIYFRSVNRPWSSYMSMEERNDYSLFTYKDGIIKEQAPKAMAEYHDYIISRDGTRIAWGGTQVPIFFAESGKIEWRNIPWNDVVRH